MAKDTDPDKLADLLEGLEPKIDPEQAAGLDPVVQLTLGFLHWETTRRNADRAFDRLMANLVDINELRVTFEPELIELIGANYPLAAQRVMRLREALNEIYFRERDWRLVSLEEKTKKEQRAYLESLPATPVYVVASVMLLSFGGHAMPVDTKLAALLAREGIVAKGTQPAEVESFLLRHVKADQAVEAHLKLQGWADQSRLSPDTSGPSPTLPGGRDGGMEDDSDAEKKKKRSRQTRSTKSGGKSDGKSGGKSGGKSDGAKAGNGKKKTTKKKKTTPKKKASKKKSPKKSQKKK